MSQSGKLPVLKAAQYSWNFALTAWRPALPALLIKAFIIALATTFMQSSGSTSFGLVLLGMVLWFVAAMACQAMLLRLAIKGEFSGFVGLQFGGDEGRLMSAQLLYSLVSGFFTFVIGFIVYILAMVYVATTITDPAIIENQDADAFIQAIVNAYSTPAGAVVALVLICLAAIPILWLTARLITFPAATIARQKVMIFETWNWTKGHAYAVILAILLAVGPVWVFANGSQLVFLKLMGLPLFYAGDAEAMASVSRMQIFIAGLFSGLVVIPVGLVSAGLSAFMYQGFKPDHSENF